MRPALSPSTASHSFVARNPPPHPSLARAMEVREFPEVSETGDTFVFDDSRRDDDMDTIADFRPGIDKVDLSRTVRFGGADFEDLLAAADQIGSDIVVDMGEGQGTLTFENVDVDDLDEGDFIF
jgi:hypothetical protein